MCVHGFNVELFEAFTWFRVLTDTMRNQAPIGSRVIVNPADIQNGVEDGSLTAFIGFSWPSNGRVLSYMSDQGEARGSAPAFADFSEHCNRLLRQYFPNSMPLDQITIERAITAENCAVAHSVKEIASVGDIDHIVATPVAIWVIETKYQRVPPEAFPKVLSRIAANTKAVRQWAPMGTTVRGCLVLAYEEKIKRREYSSEKETIIAYTPDMLVREMSREARENQRIDGQVSESIWRLGRVIE